MFDQPLQNLSNLRFDVEGKYTVFLNRETIVSQAAKIFDFCML
ncbi:MULTISPECIES: hypothetical protein [Methanobacterium]|uniref:Uncharacterized protein n=1 Tax=Methanobacterium veterum TaxID=408577 RepID=A0A9E4ZX86_9EURY|nr:MULTISPECIES: hypothetical protein [Methanobacterium]MCZ3367237.1 hypothetical protein [Methanobacterium veterum]MCZ3373615.1 hypothetical protein [Methanobacterium veterum]